MLEVRNWTFEATIWQKEDNGMPSLRRDEELAWAVFREALPDFAGERIASWTPGPDPPDVLCLSVSDRNIGVELTKWVEREQLESGKARESFERSYLKILNSETERCPGQIGMVWLLPNNRRVSRDDAEAFRRETYDFLTRQNVLPEPEWDQPQGAPMCDFTDFPLLKKYMDAFWIFPRHRYHIYDGGPMAYIPNARWRVYTRVDGAGSNRQNLRQG